MSTLSQSTPATMLAEQHRKPPSPDQAGDKWRLLV